MVSMLSIVILIFTTFPLVITKTNKKFELMLTKHAKAYSSSCSQTVSLSPASSSQFILGVCAAAEDCKNQQKPLILEVQGLLRSSV